MAVRTPGLMALALSLAALPAARADNLDAALLKQAPSVMQYLKDHHYQNVGVLKFRVQKGNQPLSFRVGPLNTNLAARLENALVLANDKAHPVGIIHDADKAAQDRRLPSYSSDAGMAKLFQQQFPLAWGNQSVQADAFLTGTVHAPAGMKTVTVTIQAFANKASKLDQVATFTVEVDRPLLNDLGQGFALSSRSLKKKTRALDLEAAEDAAGRDQAPPQAVTSGTVAPGAPVMSAAPQPPGEKLLDFQIRYDGQPQPYGPDPSNGGELLVAEPRQGQRVSFVLRNLAPERIGVVVMVNGKNSLYEQELEPAKCSMWLPEPGEEIEIKGFQVDQNTIKPFRVLSPGESEAMAYSDNLGLIGVYVFRSMRDKPEAVTPGGGGDDGMAVTGARGLRNPPAKAGLARSLADRQDQLKGVKKRGLIGSEQTQEQYQVQYKDFPNPEQQQALVIRYYRPKNR